MRKIVQGAVYDTETATDIAYGDHGDDVSQAWWRLYQTPAGAFFEVVAGHDGVIEELNPLTKAQAYKFLEVNANHLIETFFGPTPDASPSRFSRRTVIAAIEVLEVAFNQAALTRLLLKLNPELNRRCDSGSVADRLNHLIKAFDADSGQHVEDGRPLADALVEAAVSSLPKLQAESPWADASSPPVHVSAFRNALDRDGFEISETMLRRTLPSTIQLPQERPSGRIAGEAWLRHRQRPLRPGFQESFRRQLGGRELADPLLP